jgi:hypothetical protein
MRLPPVSRTSTSTYSTHTCAPPYQISSQSLCVRRRWHHPLHGRVRPELQLPHLRAWDDAQRFEIEGRGATVKPLDARSL